MRFADFESLVHSLMNQVPEEFLAGVNGVEVSRKTLPHPIRTGVYTLGECIPVPSEGGDTPSGIQSRVVLYHGSFRALAGIGESFDWDTEAWETLTHELRHHLEWRAQAPDLEAFDWAAEQNFARGDDEPFDPEFHRSAEVVSTGVYRIDDDYFLDREVARIPSEVRFEWHGTAYEITPPPEATLPAFLTVGGIRTPPPGDLVLVLRESSGLRQLFRRRAVPYQARLAARPVAGGSGLSS
jgi:hypothetical protein